MRLLGFVLAAVLLNACTSAGSFVSNIYPDGDGNLIVEKCAVNMNGFTSTVAQGECRRSRIRLNGPISNALQPKQRAKPQTEEFDDLDD